jgi:hypothetical protein
MEDPRDSVIENRVPDQTEITLQSVLTELLSDPLGKALWDKAAAQALVRYQAAQLSEQSKRISELQDLLSASRNTKV